MMNIPRTWTFHSINNYFLSLRVIKRTLKAKQLVGLWGSVFWNTILFPHCFLSWLDYPITQQRRVKFFFFNNPREQSKDCLNKTIYSLVDISNSLAQEQYIKKSILLLTVKPPKPWPCCQRNPPVTPVSSYLLASHCYCSRLLFNRMKGKKTLSFSFKRVVSVPFGQSAYLGLCI